MNQEKRFIFSIFFNLAIVLAEIVGGIISNSIALISDALHNSGDVVSMIVGYWGVRISKKGEDEKFTYGYERAKILSALVNSVFIFTLGILVLLEGFVKIIHPEKINPVVLIPVAIVGLFGNLFTIFVLKGHKHEDEDLNLKSVMVHIMGDTLSSVFIVVFGVLLLFKKWYFIDGLISIGIAFYLLIMSYKIFKKSSYIIMQGVPEGWSIEKIKNIVLNTPGVKDCHHIHIWSPDGKKVYVEFHVKKEENYNIDDVILRVKRSLVKNGVDHVTLQVEDNICPDGEKL